MCQTQHGSGADRLDTVNRGACAKQNTKLELIRKILSTVGHVPNRMRNFELICEIMSGGAMCQTEET